jgi:hypothetical protein
MEPEAEYLVLLDSYVRDLEFARERALCHYEGRLRTWTGRLGSEARAREKLAANAPLCTDLGVIGVIRKYWLACISMNRRYGREFVEPHFFALDWLRSRSPILADFLNDLPYWPIGSDDLGERIPSPPATTSHTDLFNQYVEALRSAIDEARAERQSVVAAGERGGLSRLLAEQKMFTDYGPLCTDARIIGVFRKYFLACARLNDQNQERVFISPFVFTTEMLMGSHDDLFDVLIDLPYSPIGLDENDRYV